ncbi:APC family permease [Microbaculum marinisediminis]|uniref:Amino acid permease n=1 Tax=Microbaculum marinisediminis TaxID=2931392 RepID=A0AAW5QVR6_9HYPH|nr:amino acid permease [Microbaculum sp. A6E488]MCT8970468.1 amino acid permease [Microbaculum sp. A6E488]
MSTPAASKEQPALKRGLGLWLTSFYGLGVVVGAGIYVLIGALAGIAGTAAPVSFLIAGIVAGMTALSYMELTARLPEAAGEAAYVAEGFGSPTLTLITGLAVVVVATLAAATIGAGAATYMTTIAALPNWALVAVIVIALGAISAYGIVESATFAAILTVIEIAGLVLVAVSALLAEPDLLTRIGEIAPPPTWAAWSGILAGSVLAFFAFLGFEDMVNVAEEVVEPERTLPRAIAIVMVVATLIYLAVAAICVLAVPVADLAAAPAPLALVAARGLPGAATIVTVIAISAALNGVLVQFILAPRMLYGLARRGRLPGWFGRVSARTRTPVNATVFIVVIAGFLAATLPIADLAAMSSRLILTIFVVVNLALVKIKRRGGARPAVTVPFAVPVLGAILSAALLLTSFLL